MLASSTRRAIRVTSPTTTGCPSALDCPAAAFASFRPQVVIHLAAQAGVRYSLENPRAYASANLDGFLSILEACRHNPVDHLVYASSSSVYGANAKVPFSEHDGADHPVSLYAATKRANELMAHSYSHLYGIPTTGLRFFTVYGPWGRPDMALFLFTRAILAGEPLRVFNHGRHKRSFTYVDDIVEGVVRMLDRPPTPNTRWSGDMPDPGTSGVAPYRIYNIGNERPVELLHYGMSQPVAVVITGIDSLPILQQAMEAVKSFKPMTAAEQKELLKRAAIAGQKGKYEIYKTGTDYDSTAKHPEFLG